jgi:hypothetical protein
VSRPAETLDVATAAPPVLAPAARPRRNHVGTISLVCAVVGLIGTRVALTMVDEPWLRIVAAGFEAATIGGLADWFAVTALFRHPLGLPIPHTAIIVERRAKIIESIVQVVENDWLSPGVIGARLAKVAPSTLVVDWLSTPGHVARLSAPLRDLLRGLARMLTADETSRFVESALERQLREVPIDASAGRWLAAAIESESAGTTFERFASSLANLASRPTTRADLHWWLDRSAETLRAGGKRFVPFVLRGRPCSARSSRPRATTRPRSSGAPRATRRTRCGARRSTRSGAGPRDSPRAIRPHTSRPSACGARCSRAWRRSRSSARRCCASAASSRPSSCIRRATSPC